MLFRSSDEIVVEYPVGHKRRREEGIPLLIEKYQRNLARIFDSQQQKTITDITWDYSKLIDMNVDEFVSLFVKN